MNYTKHLFYILSVAITMTYLYPAADIKNSTAVLSVVDLEDWEQQEEEEQLDATGTILHHLVSQIKDRTTLDKFLPKIKALLKRAKYLIHIPNQDGLLPINMIDPDECSQHPWLLGLLETEEFQELVHLLCNVQPMDEQATQRYYEWHNNSLLWKAIASEFDRNSSTS